MRAVNLDMKLDEIGFKIPRPIVLVSNEGLRVLRHHRHRSGRGFTTVMFELIGDHFINVMIVGQPMENVEFLDPRQVNSRIAMCMNTGARRQADGQKEQKNGNFHREVN